MAARPRTACRGPKNELFIALLVLLLAACASPPDSEPAPGKPAHHTRSGYRNLFVLPKDISFWGFQRMRHFGDDEWADYEADAHLVPVTDVDRERLAPDSDVPLVTWLGHSTVLVQYRGIGVLTDPIFSPRASPLSFAGPKRVTAPALSVDQLPPVHFVVVSHNHYDHLDAATVEAIGDSATWLTPLGYRQWFAERGVQNVVEFDWWDTRVLDGVEVTATPSQHWTARGLYDRYQALWAAWSVRIGDFNFWFAGDTGYNEHQFREIGERLGRFELGLIPIGGYGPRWFMRDMHVNPEEAVRMHTDIGARHSIGLHWGTFPLTSEPVTEPPQRLAEAARGLSGSTFVTIAIGETVALPRIFHEGGTRY